MELLSFFQWHSRLTIRALRVRCCAAGTPFLSIGFVRSKVWLIPAVVLAAFGSLAQDQSLTLDEDLLRSAEQWARQNLDENALDALDNLDREKVRTFFAEVQKQFHGEYVIDLASLKETGHALVPLLESYEETLPYAIWLKTRLDYLDVADEFRLIIPPPRSVPGQAPRPTPNPKPEKEREIWIHKVADIRWPQGSKPYVLKLKPIFAAERVPAELIWLAELESSFDPRARSPSGAAGLFQLMPATAKRYGLRTWPLDQRLNPETSAQAAARYLGYLHRRFKDWRLTIAAYNAGEQTVRTLLRRRKAQSFDQIAGALPAETQMYVPKFEAILMHREGVRLESLATPPTEPVSRHSG